jgi:hypothetical protein
MNEFDDRIRAALTPEEDPEPSWAGGPIGAAFHRHTRGLMTIAWVKMGLFVVIAAASVVMFFRAGATRDQIAWAAVFVVMSISLGIFFVLYWMELQRLAVLREIKRLELQVARLAADAPGA